MFIPIDSIRQDDTIVRAEKLHAAFHRPKKGSGLRLMLELGLGVRVSAILRKEKWQPTEKKEGDEG